MRRKLCYRPDQSRGPQSVRLPFAAPCLSVHNYSWANGQPVGSAGNNRRTESKAGRQRCALGRHSLTALELGEGVAPDRDAVANATRRPIVKDKKIVIEPTARAAVWLPHPL